MPVTAIMDAFGVSIAVTRPAPDDIPVQTRGTWLPANTGLQDLQPYGTDFNRVDPRRIMAIPITASLPSVPRGTFIVAPEPEGDALRTYQADGYEGPVESDLVRILMKRVKDW